MSDHQVPQTPRARAPSSSHPNFQTPNVARTLSSTVQSSPHYTTTRRHSLYGTEDRIILDLGSRIWKVGFSGEGKPRDLILPSKDESTSMWTLSRAHAGADREEQERILEAKLQDRLRAVFHESLLTDPKSRKIIIVEHPLIPLYIKEMIARILFNSLQVPSISFANSHLLSLLAVGRITGLVLDSGYLESTALPMFAGRPLYPLLRTTPLAGSRLTSHLRALILMFGTYIPPLSSLGSAANIPTASRSMRVPEEVLPDAVIECVKTRCCFVGESLAFEHSGEGSTQDASETPSERGIPQSDSSRRESDYSRMSVDFENASAISHRDSVVPSEFSVVSHPVTGRYGGQRNEGHLQALASLYSQHSTATDHSVKVDPPPSQQAGTGRGTLVIPGWIRERATEVLFEGGDVDESSLAEVILDALLKVPIDLRKALISSILIVGGTAMIPGFIPRLHSELYKILTQAPQQQQSPGKGKITPPSYDPYAALRPLAPYVAILNNPSPPPALTARAGANAGKAPAFSPAAMPWVGGSLAGALKVAGEEVPREKWDAADEDMSEDGPQTPERPRAPRNGGPVLPDWSRSLLPVGAPAVGKHMQLPPSSPSPAPQTAVGA